MTNNTVDGLGIRKGDRYRDEETGDIVVIRMVTPHVLRLGLVNDIQYQLPHVVDKQIRIADFPGTRFSKVEELVLTG